jgi:hypothetical protein
MPAYKQFIALAGQLCLKTRRSSLPITLATEPVSFTLVVGIGNAFIGHKSQHFIFVVGQTFK